jgi:hypothetical protein
MGIWDVCRLMARRWPVSVPLLLLTAGATLVAAFNVKPDYVGTTHVSLLPPTLQRSAAAGQTLKVNPWDTEALASAVAVRLNSNSAADQIRAEGFERVWEAGLDGRYKSVVRIEVTSPTRAQAESTLARLLREVDDEVGRQQAKYPNLTPDDKITVSRLDSADDVETATGNVKRASVMVAVAGLLLTTAATAGVDAARRRRRIGGLSSTTRASAPMPTSADTDATQPVVITNVPLHMPVAGATPATLSNPGRYVSSGQGPSTGAGPDDSTIVLPLSNAPWADRPRSATLGNGMADRDDTTADVG